MVSETADISVAERKKREKLKSLIREMPGAVVAFSGGIDSTLLVKVCFDLLATNALAVIARSESYPKRELEEAVSLAERIGVPYRIVDTDELSDPNYSENPVNRCFFCKEELLSRLELLRKQEGFAEILLGNNADDTGDFRPGMQSAENRGVRSPMLEAGLTKGEIRRWAKELGLPNWNRPSSACLSSRIPYGEAITSEKLSRVERAEDLLHDLGFRQVRVRSHDTIARVELLEEEIDRFLSREIRQTVSREFKSLGFLFVTLDLEPFRTGRLSSALREKRG